MRFRRQIIAISSNGCSTFSKFRVIGLTGLLALLLMSMDGSNTGRSPQLALSALVSPITMSALSVVRVGIVAPRPTFLGTTPAIHLLEVVVSVVIQFRRALTSHRIRYL